MDPYQKGLMPEVKQCMTDGDQPEKEKNEEAARKALESMDDETRRQMAEIMESVDTRLPKKKPLSVVPTKDKKTT